MVRIHNVPGTSPLALAPPSNKPQKSGWPDLQRKSSLERAAQSIFTTPTLASRVLIHRHSASSQSGQGVTVTITTECEPTLELNFYLN